MIAGQYEQKQLLSRSRLVSWSHGARFRTARRLVAPYAGQRLLDYGCGDGTFLKSVSDLFTDLTGADAAQVQIDDCRRRLPEISFVHVDKLEGKFDVITCMEVLEHCQPATVEEILARFASLVNPQGTIIISVPVETGLMLLSKQMARRVAGWRGIGDYRFSERYTWRELLKMTFATAETSINRDLGIDWYGHKGFNWRALEKKLKRHFYLKQRLFSPNLLLRSQVWFICQTSRR